MFLIVLGYSQLTLLDCTLSGHVYWKQYYKLDIMI
jgi:hypothetical protein